MTERAPSQPTFVKLMPGDRAPSFSQRTGGNSNYSFDSTAGRYLVLAFYMSTSDDAGAVAARAVAENRSLFDDQFACFFGVSVDPADESEGRIRDVIPGIRFFLDFDRRISRLYGAVAREVDANPAITRRFWLVLDPTMRIMAIFPLTADPESGAQVMAYLRDLPPPHLHAGFEIPAPILVLPNVFEPAFCQKLIGDYERAGGEESGFMREVGGQTVPIHDHSHKRRKDYTIEDAETIKAVQARIIRRINPEIERVYAFKATRMERYIVGCYAAEDGAHFRPHRDNTTRGTAHRRFAVSINLNGDFEGGAVSFPEYAERGYKAPPGGAVIFPCGLLHAVSKVTSGRRYAFLPFLYDDAAAQMREANSQFLAGSEPYKANAQPAPAAAKA